MIRNPSQETAELLAICLAATLGMWYIVVLTHAYDWSAPRSAVVGTVFVVFWFVVLLLLQIRTGILTGGRGADP